MPSNLRGDDRVVAPGAPRTFGRRFHTNGRRVMVSGTTDLAAALAGWQRAIGAGFVITDPEATGAAERATYVTGEGVSAILRPGNREEVQACVRVAGTYCVPLYPVSTGRNWGYGSRVPTFDGCVLLELSRLDRIVDFNEELAYVVVEPGVTQRMLDVFLREVTGHRLWLDATSSSGDCSVVGNLLERGHGVTPYCDHVACSADYEVVLANGDCINTGYGAFGNANVAGLDAWGLGPALMGLFSQSNFGVVTRATVWLMRQPEQSAVAFFQLDDDQALSALLDELRPLRLDRILKSGPFFGNVYQALQKVMRYPWDRTGGEVPLPLGVALELGAAHGYGLWNGSVGLWGTEEEVTLQRQRLARALKSTASWSSFVYDESDIERVFPTSRHSEVRSVVAGFTGGVGGTGLRSPYWRMRDTPCDDGKNIDLDRDGCGIKFSTAVSPFRGHDALAVSSLATEILLRHRLEPAIGIFPVRERTLQYHISCAYDRAVADDDAAVVACHEQLSAELMDLGYYPTRLGVGSMSPIERRSGAYAELLRTLKAAVDPMGILAPFRYDSGGGR